jgi:hypothetical protein
MNAPDEQLQEVQELEDREAVHLMFYGPGPSSATASNPKPLVN